MAITSTVPTVCAGTRTVHSVAEAHSTFFDFVEPNMKVVPVAPVAKPAPVIVTLSPPAFEPVLGLTPATAGISSKRSFVDVVLVPDGAVTVTSTVAAVCAGDTAVIEVGELTVKLVAAIAPNITALAPVKLVPVIVTAVPPAAVPLVGDSFLTAGAGR